MKNNDCRHCPEDMHGFVFCREKWVKFPSDTQKCKKCGQIIPLQHSKISHFMIIILTICLLLTSRFCLSFILRRWPDPYLFGGIGSASLLLVFLIWKRGAIFQHWRQAIATHRNTQGRSKTTEKVGKWQRKLRKYVIIGALKTRGDTDAPRDRKAAQLSQHVIQQDTRRSSSKGG